MTQFEDREKGFERKYEMEQEARFGISMRATKMTGKWAAQKLGLPEEKAEAYVKELLEVELSSPRHSELVSKIEQDFANARINALRAEIAREMEANLAKAKAEIAGQ